jgi:hypothetical protein
LGRIYSSTLHDVSLFGQEITSWKYEGVEIRSKAPR